MELILRIIAVLLIIGLIAAGYSFIKDWKQARLEAEYQKYAAIITETSLAAELYRNDKPGFLAARDSILSRRGVTREEMVALLEKFTSEKWAPADFWKYVAEMTDSATRARDSIRIMIQKDSSASVAPVPDSSDST